MPKQSLQTFTLGTAVKITTKLSVSNPSSVKITVEDPTEAVKTNLVDMTQDTPNTYHYVYQSATTDEDGLYIVTIRAVYGAYTALSQTKFELIDLE